MGNASSSASASASASGSATPTGYRKQSMESSVGEEMKESGSISKYDLKLQREAKVLNDFIVSKMESIMICTNSNQCNHNISSSLFIYVP